MDKSTLIIKLGSPIGRNKWQPFNHNCRYGQVEIECYDKNNKRYSSTLFFDEKDTVYLVNTGFSIGVSVNSKCFIYGDVIKFTDLSKLEKVEVCFSEVKDNERNL